MTYDLDATVETPPAAGAVAVAVAVPVRRTGFN
jgi:hypothetical protein